MVGVSSFVDLQEDCSIDWEVLLNIFMHRFESATACENSA